MLYSKYESSGPCSFGQQDYWKLHFENLFFDPVTYLCNQLNGLNNFDRGLPRDHSWEVWSKSNKWFQRRCCLKKLLTHARMDRRTDDGRQTMGHHKSSPWAQLSTLCSGELKKLKDTIHFQPYEVFITPDYTILQRELEADARRALKKKRDEDPNGGWKLGRNFKLVKKTPSQKKKTVCWTRNRC